MPPKKKKLLLVFVGEEWPAKPEPPDNVTLSVDPSEPLSKHAADICKKLGVAGIDEVSLFQGSGTLPDVSAGAAFDLEKSPKDEGLVPDDAKDGDEPIALIFVKKKTDDQPAEGEDGGAEGKEAPADPPVETYDAAGAAKTIFEAIDGLGTDEGAIYKTVESVNRHNDWCAIAREFKANHAGCHDGDLLKALKDDLTDEEYDKIKESLAAKLIDIEDLTPKPEDPAAGGGGGGGGAPAADPNAKCPDCDNLMSQPFCGKTGRPHPQQPAAGAGGAGGAASGQFSSDRACTQCGDGMLDDEPRQAVYVCLDCDGKFCEVCWDFEHRNKKRAGHQQYLLFFDCDLCKLMPTREPKAAVWFCDPCKMLLCAQCWHGEHKNPLRRDHLPQFLYPGGEHGPHRAATIDAQPVDTTATEFDVSPHGAFIRSPQDLICTVCNSASGNPAIYICNECDPSNPEMLCEECWAIEHRMPHRRGHPKRFLLHPCEICGDREGKPAIMNCAACHLKLCANCWENEHKNPARQGHTGEQLYRDTPNTGPGSFLGGTPYQGAPYAPHHPMSGPASPYSDYGSPHRIMTPGPPSLSPDRDYVYDPFASVYDTYDTMGYEMDGQVEMERFHHYRQRLCRFYQVYNPSKLPSVSSCLKEYQGYEEDLMAALVRRYGPEPIEDTTPLPPGWRLVESTRGDLFYINNDGRKQWQRPVI
ncbi:hypothetical protein DIPPA_09738 [Diplonema papillatum]|nr:hypothetical protein DIPPA_09738 [Diplonema papillatum]